MDPTRTEIASPVTLHPHGEEKIPRNSVLSNFEEKLREIDAAISKTDTKLANLPLLDHTPDCEENKERFLEFPPPSIKVAPPLPGSIPS